MDSNKTNRMTVWHHIFLWPMMAAFAGAGMVSLGVAGLNAFSHPSATLWMGILCQLILFCSLVGLAVQRRFFQSATSWIILLLIVTIGLRAFFLVQFPDYRLLGDHKYLYDFAEQLARGGMTQANLAALNHNYDWASFLSRSLALPFPLSLLFPAHHLLVYHIALLVLAAGSLLCLGYLSYRLLPLRASRLALALYAAAPLRLWEVLGYPVDPLREFILLFGLVLLFRLFHSRGRMPVRIVTACGLALVMFLGHLQQGIDVFLMASLVFMGIGTLVLVAYELNQSSIGQDLERRAFFNRSSQRPRRDNDYSAGGGEEKSSLCALRASVQTLPLGSSNAWLGDGVRQTWWRGPVLYLLISAAIYLVSARVYDHWQDRMDIRGWRQSLGSTAYIATGFNLNKLGEFEPHIWAMAVEAPPELKKPMMLAHVWSNIAYQPVRVFATLFPVKAIKLFLVGYGSGMEQGLQASGYAGAGEFFKGMRLAYTPLFLFVVLLGGWRLLQSRLTSLWLVLVLCILPLLSCMLFVVMGEVQPRYSYYTFFALCMIAGACVASDAFPRIPRPAFSSVIRYVLLMAGLYVMLAGLAYGATRLFMADSTFLDVRPAVTRASWGSGGACDGAVPSGYRPYLRHIVLPQRSYATNDMIECELKPTRRAGGVVRMSAMLWPGDMTELQQSAFHCTVRFGGEAVYTGPLIAKPRCVTTGWITTIENGEMPPVTVEIACKAEVPLKIVKPTEVLRWGFVYIERQPKPE
jgi:hypothetical protein